MPYVVNERITTDTLVLDDGSKLHFCLSAVTMPVTCKGVLCDENGFMSDMLYAAGATGADAVRAMLAQLSASRPDGRYLLSRIAPLN